MKLKIGDRAPSFTLKSNGDKEIFLDSLRGKKIILYFYPKDNTPGCTLEARDFSALALQFRKLNTIVIGISKDTPQQHDKFCQKYRLNIQLGSDIDGKVLSQYGAWKEKSLYGKTFMGIQRSTFLIDELGFIQAIWPKVNVKGHAEEVLEAVKKLATAR